MIVVPRRRAASRTSLISPPITRITVPAPSAGAVSTSSSDTEAIAGSASPRKPKLRTPTRSSAAWIFEVAWRCEREHGVLALHPAAIIGDADARAAAVVHAMSIVVAPASSEFSTSSFTTDAGRSTTSPAAI